MTEQSAQLQALEQALQDKGIKYRIDKASMKEVTHLDHVTEPKTTTITVEVYDTGDV